MGDYVKGKNLYEHSTLKVYGDYKTNAGNMAERIDLGDAFFSFIEDVLNEYNALGSAQEKKAYKFSWDIMAHGYDDTSDKWKQNKFDKISQQEKNYFEADLNAALLCRLVKDAIYCFDHKQDEVDKNHAHYFNQVLTKVEELLK